MKKEYSIYRYFDTYTPRYFNYTSSWFFKEYGSWRFFDKDGEDVWDCDEGYPENVMQFDNFKDAKQFIKERIKDHKRSDIEQEQAKLLIKQNTENTIIQC